MSLPSEVTDADGGVWVVVEVPDDGTAYDPPQGGRRAWLAPKPRDAFAEPRVDDVFSGDDGHCWRVVEVTHASVILVTRRNFHGSLTDVLSQVVSRVWLSESAQWTLKRRAEEVDA